MLEAVKSLLGGAIGSQLSSQFQPQADLNPGRRPPPSDSGSKKPAMSDPAVEINLSAQARQIMAALEKGEFEFNDSGLLRGTRAAGDDFSPIPEKTDAPFEPFKVFDGLVRQLAEFLETRDGQDDIQAKMKHLFDQVGAIMTEIDSETAPLPAEAAESAESAEPVALSSYDQLKAVILFGELNRLLGNVGVFFGRDLALVRMSVAARERAGALYDALSETLGTKAVNNMHSPQEVKIDAIFRELEQLYSRLDTSGANEITGRIDSFLTRYRQ